MAKATNAAVKAAVESTVATVSLALPADFKAEYQDTATGVTYTIDTAALANPATVAYLLTNGFRQSIIDAAALDKEERAEHTAKGTLAEHVKGLRDKRFAAILAGEVGSGARGPRLVGIDKIRRDVGQEMATAAVKKALAKNSLPMPSKENFAVLVNGWLAKPANAADVETEAQRRFKALDSGAADESADILAELAKLTAK